MLLLINIVQCGMRRPSLGQNDGDLSRLTSASSDTESYSGSSQQQNTVPIITKSYLPELLDSNDWAKSRKRKERQDSTSSITQDRKLIRSNSEEYIPNLEYDCIRRVSSHEDFKKPSPLAEIKIIDDELHENCKQNNDESLSLSTENDDFETIKTIDTFIEKSPNLSKTNDYSYKYRLSPSRDGKYKSDDNTDCEHERQRYSERFSKTRAPGRKSISPRKSSKHSSSSKLRGEKRDENCYKYDISALKYERRGFVSKHKYDDSCAKEEENTLTAEQPELSDYNDNNLIDTNEYSKSPKIKDDILPWNHMFEEEGPIVCQRFADNTFDHVNNSQGKVIKVYNVPFGTSKISDNHKTRDVIKKLPSDEKVKQINKRLILLKKRVNQYEDKFEYNYGHRPSQFDKTNDKVMKNLIGEMSKLRREKHHLRSEPKTHVLKDEVSVELRGEIKLNKMKDTILEIEKRLNKKRNEEHRCVELDALTPDELVKEKTAVQKGLLYLESIFGRPISRDERDVARPLYDRYRVIKRLVNRNDSLSGSGISVPELPTILEHEAMAFTGVTTQSSSSNDKTTLSTLTIVESPSDNSDSIQSTDSTDTSSSMTENVHTMSIQELWNQLDTTREETKNLKRTIKEFEEVFEERNGRKMLKSDRKLIEETYSLYKQKKAKVRLLDALIKKHMLSY